MTLIQLKPLLKTEIGQFQEAELVDTKYGYRHGGSIEYLIEHFSNCNISHIGAEDGILILYSDKTIMFGDLESVYDIDGNLVNFKR